MEKKIITQAQRTKMFNEWLLTQEMPNYEHLIERQRWWVNKCIEHDKLLHNEGYDIVPGFYVDNNGKVHYDDKEK